MAFKYESHLNELNCDLARFTERNGRNAFCWAFSPISDARNFVPRAVAIGRNECSSWGLSFFETENQAKARLKYLMIKTPNLYLKLGTHIAYGQLTKESGVSENADSVGHFNHHEYTDNNFSATFSIGGSSYQ